MTHAFLCCEEKTVKPHGREFKQKIKELNEILSINITTKHQYINWYRCDGQCRNFETTYFGYISRPCHLKPSDPATHKAHQAFCSGKYIEAEEPTKNLLQIILKRFMENKASRRKEVIKNVQVKVQVIGQAFKPRNMQPPRLKIVDYVTSEEE